MSNINIPRESTMQEISQALQTIAFTQAGQAYNITTLNYIAGIVRKGLAQKVFNIGDQIVVPWTDVATGQKYEAVADIVSFQNVTLKDGETVPGMIIQWHYAIPFGVQFDQNEAFYYCAEELTAGTYHITVGANWGTHCKNGETYQFVLTKNVPAGGQLHGFYGMPDQAPANWRVSSYASAQAAEPIETVSVAVGSQGTDLGSFVPAGTEGLNSLYRLAYGYNRWSQSGIRQWLNSDKGVGQWWAPQNNYDRAPDQLKTKAGFLTGFDEEFLSCIQPIKVATALNTVTDAAVGDTEDTYDLFFLPSLEQMYINPQLAGEGEPWDYWKRASGMTQKMDRGGTYPQIRTFAIENHTSPQYVRLRSASRSGGNDTWYVYSSGNVGSYAAVDAIRCAPACAIC